MISLIHRSKDHECQLEEEFLVHRCSELCQLLQRFFREAILIGLNLKEELKKFNEKALNICKFWCLGQRGGNSKVLDDYAHGSFLRNQETTDAWRLIELEGNSQKRFQVFETFQDEELLEDNSEEGRMEKRIVEVKRRYNDPVEHCIQKCKLSNLSRLTCLIKECQSANVVLRKKFVWLK